MEENKNYYTQPGAENQTEEQTYGQPAEQASEQTYGQPVEQTSEQTYGQTYGQPN